MCVRKNVVLLNEQTFCATNGKYTFYDWSKVWNHVKWLMRTVILWNHTITLDWKHKVIFLNSLCTVHEAEMIKKREHWKNSLNKWNFIWLIQTVIRRQFNDFFEKIYPISFLIWKWLKKSSKRQKANKRANEQYIFNQLDRLWKFGH